MNRVTIDEFEKYHARALRKPPPPVSIKEVLITLLISIGIAPFIFATFFIIPMMGQVTVGLAGLITALYLYFRQSLVIFATVIASSAVLSSIAFMSIQSVKYRLDVTLFVLIALGIPVTAGYTVFIAMKIWELRGGGE